MSTEAIIGFGDHVGTRARVSVDVDELEPGEEPAIHVSVGVGMSEGRGMPTPTAARQFAAALLDAADEAEHTTTKSEGEPT